MKNEEYIGYTHDKTYFSCSETVFDDLCEEVDEWDKYSHLHKICSLTTDFRYSFYTTIEHNDSTILYKERNKLIMDEAEYKLRELIASYDNNNFIECVLPHTSSLTDDEIENINDDDLFYNITECNYGNTSYLYRNLSNAVIIRRYDMYYYIKRKYPFIKKSTITKSRNGLSCLKRFRIGYNVDQNFCNIRTTKKKYFKKYLKKRTL